jgi:non-ribosomal peptide synthetase component F
MGVFLGEILALYKAVSRGEPSALPELPIQYVDFAHWQRRRLSGERLAGHLAYWRKALSELPVLRLPTDRERPARRSYRGATHEFRLAAELTRRLEELSQREGVTLFMTLLSAFKVLLSRYSGQEDIVVGSGIANRNRAETEKLIGFFVNMLVLRTDLSGDPSFREVVARVREVCLGAYAHQDMPFERLVEELERERETGRDSLFQAAIAHQNFPMPVYRGSVLVEPVKVEWGTSKFDLTLFVWESPEGLYGFIEYSTELFHRETIARLWRHFETLLSSAVANPDGKIRDLPLMNEEERSRIVRQWARSEDRFETEGAGEASDEVEEIDL